MSAAVATAVTKVVSVQQPTIPSCEVCGWIAAACSAIAFGTFAVPIKSDVARSVNIDPLVFQSYKTFMCFMTAWFILLLPGQKFTFTPWGIVSGLFWVPRYVTFLINDSMLVHYTVIGCAYKTNVSATQIHP
jgi:hypothetical protein